MKCLQCGYCCIYYDVMIIAPHEVKEDLVIDSKHSFEVIPKRSGKECPHLRWEENKAVCSIHHYKWYKDTPCFHHGQVEKRATEFCRIGAGIQSGKVRLIRPR